MYRDHTVGLVIPAYNEEGFVGDVVREIPDIVDAVFLVDDASTDGTWAEMGRAMREVTRTSGAADTAAEPNPDQTPESDAGARVSDPLEGSMTQMARAIRRRGTVADGGDSPGARVDAVDRVGRMTRLRHAENRGAGGAIKTGYLVAMWSGVDLVATVDGDGQMDIDRLPALLDPLASGEAGYAKGDRFAGREGLGEMPTFRLFGNVLLTGLTRLASGYWRLSDPQNGFTAVRRDVLEAVDVEGLWEYYGYMNHLMAQLNAADVTIADVPMPATYGDEESSIDYPQYIRRVSLLLLLSYCWRLWTKYAEWPPDPALVGYVSSLLSAANGLRRLPSAVRGEEGSTRDVGLRLAAAVGALVGASVRDRAAESTVIRGERSPSRDRSETDGGER